ncbi:MAG: FMN-binding protein [Kiritimatiellae bacterium]|nr:FMN-binding protein [Kiritimatiellia bacterium]
MKKILGLVLSLTIISGVCAAVLAYVDSITKEPIKRTAERNREAARAAVLCGEEGYTAEGTCKDGYGGDITLMVGFKKDRKTVISYKVLAASETPGLGMKLKTPEFADQFKGKDGSSLKVKKDGGEIEAITSATITSRAVCRAIEDAQRKL